MVQGLTFRAKNSIRDVWTGPNAHSIISLFLCNFAKAKNRGILNFINYFDNYLYNFVNYNEF